MGVRVWVSRLAFPARLPSMGLIVPAGISIAIAIHCQCTPLLDLALAASPNAMAVDAIGGDGVDTDRIVAGTTEPFKVDIVITAADTPYARYQYDLEWDPAVLAYDSHASLSPDDLTLCAGPNLTARAIAAGCERPSGTTTFAGPVNTLKLHCVGEGTSRLHLRSTVEEPTLGTGTFDESGLVIPTVLADASITCIGGPTDTRTPTSTSTPMPPPPPTPTPRVPTPTSPPSVAPPPPTPQVKTPTPGVVAPTSAPPTQALPSPFATRPATAERMAVLEWPKRMRPSESRQAILWLSPRGEEPRTPEQEEGELEPQPMPEPLPLPGLDLYAGARLSTGLTCEPECEKWLFKPVAPGQEIVWRWTIGPNPQLDGTHHANVSAYWCWKAEPEGPCVQMTANFFDHSFDVDLSTGTWSDIAEWVERIEPLWRVLTLSGPIPWSVLGLWYVVRVVRGRLGGTPQHRKEEETRTSEE